MSTYTHTHITYLANKLCCIFCKIRISLFKFGVDLPCAYQMVRTPTIYWTLIYVAVLYLELKFYLMWDIPN